MPWEHVGGFRLYGAFPGAFGHPPPSPSASSGATKYLKITDRREAIRAAIGLANTGVVVLIAGKGHETTQVIGDRELPFDDRLVAAELARA